MHDNGPLNQFFAKTRQAMYVTRRTGEILDCNQSFEDTIGYSRADLIGHLVQTILEPGEDRGQYQERIENHGFVADYPIAMRRGNGMILPCMVDATPWEEAGSIAGYVGMVRPLASFASRPHGSSDDSTATELHARSRRTATVLFFDIRNSTAIAESCSPENFASFLSDILSDIMDLIYGCHGSVNKLLGDGLLAVFGAPFSRDNDAANALEAANRIRDYLDTFNDVRPGFLEHPVTAGIGIATGPVFAGLIGSVHRQEYTVLGDPVNVASRLQGLTKQVGETILMDEATALEAGNAFPCKALYQGKVRGRQERMRIFGLPAHQHGCTELDSL